MLWSKLNFSLQLLLCERARVLLARLYQTTAECVIYSLSATVWPFMAHSYSNSSQMFQQLNRQQQMHWLCVGWSPANPLWIQGTSVFWKLLKDPKTSLSKRSPVTFYSQWYHFSDESCTKGVAVVTLMIPMVHNALFLLTDGSQMCCGQGDGNQSKKFQLVEFYTWPSLLPGSSERVVTLHHKAMLPPGGRQ